VEILFALFEIPSTTLGMTNASGTVNHCWWKAEKDCSGKRDNCLFWMMMFVLLKKKKGQTNKSLSLICIDM